MKGVKKSWHIGFSDRKRKKLNLGLWMKQRNSPNIGETSQFKWRSFQVIDGFSYFFQQISFLTVLEGVDYVIFINACI